MGQQVITRKALKERCARDASSVLNRGLASENELAALTPGGERNPDRSVWGWLHYYVCLHRFLERENVAAGRSVKPDQRRSPGQDTGDELPDAELVLAMLNSEGETLMLKSPLRVGEFSGFSGAPKKGDDEHEPDVRIGFLTVEPKGISALTEIERLHTDTRWLTARLAVLHDAMSAGVATAEDLHAATLTAERLVEYQARIVWILTSDGPECPYDPTRDADVEAPRHLRSIDPVDLTRLFLVAHRVQGERVALLKSFIPRDTKSRDGAANWGHLAGAVARGMNADPEHLIKHWSREKVVATAALAAIDRTAAEKAAKERAEEDRRRRSA
jgi:hypothetical protein